MNATVVDRLLPLVLQYAEGRLAQKALRRAYVALRCELVGPGLGATVVGPCYGPRVPGDEAGGWCATCQQRDPLFSAYRLRKRENRVLLARIEALAPRLTLPDVPAEAAEPKLLLDLMDTEPPRLALADQGEM